MHIESKYKKFEGVICICFVVSAFFMVIAVCALLAMPFALLISAITQ